MPNNLAWRMELNRLDKQNFCQRVSRISKSNVNLIFHLVCLQSQTDKGKLKRLYLDGY